MEIENEPKAEPENSEEKVSPIEENKKESAPEKWEKAENIEILPGEGEFAKLQIKARIIFERYSETRDGIKVASREIGEHSPEWLPKPPAPENGIYRHGNHLVQIIETHEEGVESSLIRVIEIPETI